MTWIGCGSSSPFGIRARPTVEIAVFDDLPVLRSQRITGYVALFGGGVGEVVLSRVTRLSFTRLADALLPGTGSDSSRSPTGRSRSRTYRGSASPPI